MDSVPSSFQAAASGLRAKRRALSKGLSEYIKAIKNDGLPTIEAFRAKRGQFEREWDDVVKANDNCLSLLNTGDDGEVRKVEDLNEALDAVRDKKELLEFYESEILRKSAELIDRKSVVALENVETVSSISEGAENVTEEVDSLENVQTPDMTKNPVPSGIKNEMNDLSIPHEENGGILNAIQDLGKSFYVQLSENSARTDDNMNAMNANIHNLSDNVQENMNALHRDMGSLHKDITQLSNEISTVQGKVDNIQGEVIDLRTENVDMRKELENHSLNTENKIKSLIKRIDGVNDRVGLVESTVNVPNAFSNATVNPNSSLTGLKKASNHSAEVSRRRQCCNF